MAPRDVVRKNAPIQIVGYPENIRVIDLADNSGCFNAIGGLDIIADFTDRDILLAYDADKVLRAPAKPPRGYNMSGSSGGIAVIHDVQNGLHRWRPVGLFLSGPRGQGEGEAANFDLIWIRRIDCIAEDGLIRAPDSGWLPR